MPTTYGNDIVYCLKSHCGVRGYCRQKWVLQVQIICKFSNERTCKRNKDVQGLSCGFEVIYNSVTHEGYTLIPSLPLDVAFSVTGRHRFYQSYAVATFDILFPWGDMHPSYHIATTFNFQIV